MSEPEVTPDAIMQLGLGVLGLEDAAERRRAGALHGAGERGRARRRGAAASAWACTRGARGTSSTRWSRWACSSARTAATPTRRRPTCSSTARSLPTSAASWRWRTPGSTAFWGSLTEGLQTGLPQNEAKGGDDFFATLYADPERLAQFAHGDERHQRWARHGDRAEVPLGRPRQRDRHRLRRGRRAGPDRAGPRAPHRRRLRPAAGRAALRGVRRRGSDSPTA